MIPFCVRCVTAAKIIPVGCACQQISVGKERPEIRCLALKIVGKFRIGLPFVIALFGRMDV
jgi:hypothetical protein